MMHKNNKACAGVAQGNAADTRLREVADLLGKLQRLLDEGQAAAALERIGRSKLRSPWMTNATAVCQLRLGKANLAVRTLRGLVLAESGVILRQDVPVVFKINFAIALIMDGNVSGGLATLSEIREEEHPAVQEVGDSIRQWRASMTFWQRLSWTLLGVEPARPLVLDFPPGRLQ